jgi:hypothetical protein
MGKDIQTVPEPRRPPSGFERLEEVRDRLNEQFSQKPPMAYSADGQFFHFESTITTAVRTGSYVVITGRNGENYLGQVMGQAIIEREGPEYGLSMGATAPLVVAVEQAHFRDRITRRLLKGHGLLLGKIVGADFELSKRLSKFQDASLSEAPALIVDQYFSRIRPRTGAIDVGTPIHGTEKCRVFLDGAAFNRHTFLTGQSRSGKSFAMGVILEQLLLETKIRIVVIDPNSDFIRTTCLRSIEKLNEVRPIPIDLNRYNEIQKKYAKSTQNVVTLGAAEVGDEKYKKLRIRFSELTQAEKPAVLRLDPLQNREEFHSLNAILDGIQAKAYSLEDVSNIARDKFFSDASQNIGLRIANLGIRKWPIWAKNDDRSLIEILNNKRRCTVVDTGSLNSEEEKLMTAMVVLGHLWDSRVKREPVLIIIDEAHNIAPSTPASELQRVCNDLIVRIAGEGLKYGIHLMVATQRPGKLNPNVMTQCDNQIVMRMLSSADLATVTEAFSQIPSSLIHECTKFETGNALIAGRIASVPTFVKFDGRVSEEGGADMVVNWANSS